MRRIVLMVIGLLLITGCAGGTKRDAAYNEQDVEFVRQMIPHHQQAIEMSELVLGRGYSPQVLQLSDQIRKAQGPEITTMQGWLDDWDVDPMSHEEMDDMSSMDLDALEAVKGDAFDALWVAMMIEHHEGAIAMGREESTNGKSLKVKNLAREIIDAQEKEISTMKGLLP